MTGSMPAWPVVLVCVSVLGPFGGPASHAAPLKPRVVVLTDIAPNEVEPDDAESLVRLLVHADLFEIEGLVATTGWSNWGGQERPDLIHKAIDAYEKDLPNLQKRSDQNGQQPEESRQQMGYWPSPDYLRSRTVLGSLQSGFRMIGQDNDSDGSRLIVDLADEEDDRPLWVLAWGGGNTLAQAIWRVQQDRSEEELKAFLYKIRFYAITDQDMKYQEREQLEISSHQWMRREFEKDLFFIWDECAWKFQNGTGKSNWDEYAAHIQTHGHLGAVYPKFKYGVEGDTPSFLYVMPIGLNDPEHPTQGGWGGYFERGECPDGKTVAYTNHENPAKDICYRLLNHFYPATFNNFAARMDWAHAGAGNRNPAVVVNGDQTLDILVLKPKAGSTVTLDASETHDPDGDELAFKWWVPAGPGSYTGNIPISDADSSRTTVKIPEDSADKTFHVICEVTDNGTPTLTGYRRILFEPE